MATKAGVWIDHKQAIVVFVTDAGNEIKKIASGIETPVRSAGGSKSKNSFTPNDFIAEDKLERKFENQLKKFYDEVTTCLQTAKALLILGPGEAKGEFHKRSSKKLRSVAVELETAGKMTDRQLAAKVAQHFAAKPAKKAVAPKKPTKKKATKKRPKKAGK